MQILRASQARLKVFRSGMGHPPAIETRPQGQSRRALWRIFRLGTARYSPMARSFSPTGNRARKSSSCTAATRSGSSWPAWRIRQRRRSSRPGQVNVLKLSDVTKAGNKWVFTVEALGAGKVKLSAVDSKGRVPPELTVNA